MSKRNVWKDPSPYGTYRGKPGNPGSWQSAFEERMTKPEALAILGEQTPFDVLGLAEDASSSEIKRAFRKMAMRYHPDTGREEASAETFIKVRAAYELLIDGENDFETLK